MKWLLYLFAGFLLVLPCLPCNATEACCTDEMEQTAADQDCDHRSEKDAAEDHSHKCPCCPSFSCNTCHSIVAFPVMTIIAYHFRERTAINYFYKEDKLSQFSSAIWQPPQL
jgi:hypothetical protein